MTSTTAGRKVDPALSQQIAELLIDGGTLGTAIGYTEQDYETLYSLGHNLYANARYQEAVQVFGFLVMHHHLEPRYMNAHASSLQMVGRYKEAIEFYSIASLLDIEDPLPTFYTAECLLALNLVAEAKEALGIALSQSDGPQHAELKKRALAMQTLLNAANRASPAH